MQKDFTPFIKRRARLVSSLQKAFPDKKGTVILCAGFESPSSAFVQESSFYYFTGLEEPGLILLLDLDGSTTLYTPQYSADRSAWVLSTLAHKGNEGRLGVNEIRHLGSPCKGYSISPLCLKAEYETVIADVQRRAEQGESLFADYSSKGVQQTLVLERILRDYPELTKSILSISSFVASMRRTKDKQELESLSGAVDVTIAAHEWASTLIEPGIFENELQAIAEFVFRNSGAAPAFPPIIAGGRNSTVLHYTRNDQELKKGDLVVIDIGARVEHYCADLARTYPVSGTFTEEQRKIYDLVVEAQSYVADNAKPGYWIINNDVPNKSLHHLALEFFHDHGFGGYFNHLIGHFIGLDVHDVGDYKEPLKEGDVFTLEPGIYMPKSGIGIRVEDNYWMTEKGAICLSEELPRDSYEVEEMMQQEIEES